MIEAPRLVYFHNHSQQGSAMVLMPKANTHNVWTFEEEGYLVSSESFVASLSPLKPQGVYRLREHFHPNELQLVNKDAITQLGYNAEGEPILFFPKMSDDFNGLVFPAQGMKVPPSIYELLEPLDLVGPYTPGQCTPPQHQLH